MHAILIIPITPTFISEHMYMIKTLAMIWIACSSTQSELYISLYCMLTWHTCGINQFYHEYRVDHWLVLYVDTVLYIHVDIPEPPLNVGALGLRSLSESDCEVLVKWDPPAISFDIAHYIVYVPALDVNINETSFITSLLLRNCPETFGVTVAAINRFGCIGISSSEVCIELTPQSTSPPAPEFGRYNTCVCD